MDLKRQKWCLRSRHGLWRQKRYQSCSQNWPVPGPALAMATVSPKTRSLHNSQRYCWYFWAYPLLVCIWVRCGLLSCWTNQIPELLHCGGWKWPQMYCLYLTPNVAASSHRWSLSTWKVTLCLRCVLNIKYPWGFEVLIWNKVYKILSLTFLSY